ncbi:thioredoxin domain-containing protein [uncultured Microscilla sp.]|uniref:TlpA family protein disulfide reductase n=1 Tax=uncultured Microscilla sp. TaxID=432653 RepID=UPI00261D84A3|nr:thioredoxin domain-containing protein [uncultured Microscilla sp.]
MFSLFTTSKKGQPSVVKKPGKPRFAARLIVVKRHADWCAASKVMTPVFNDLKNRFDGREVLFVDFNYTNNTSRYQSDLLATALGVARSVKKHAGTGFILLIDAETKQVIEKFTRRQSFEEMVNLLKDRLLDSLEREKMITQLQKEAGKGK